MADTTFLHHLRDEIDAEIKAQEGTTGGGDTGGGSTGGGGTGTLTLMPANAKPGDLVTITGRGFGTTGAVSTGNYPNTNVSWADDLIVSRLHPGIPPGVYNVYINSVWLGLSITALAADGTGGDTGGGDTGGGDTGGGTGGDTGGDGTGGGDTGGGDTGGGGTTGEGSEGGVGFVSGGNGQPIVVNYIAPQKPGVAPERPVFKTVAGMSLEMIQPVHPPKSEVVFTWNNPDAHDPPHAYCFGDSIPDSEMIVQAAAGVPFSAVTPGYKNAEIWTHNHMRPGGRFTPGADGKVSGTFDLTGEKNGPLNLRLLAWNSPPGGASADGTFRQGKLGPTVFVEGGANYVKPIPAAAAGMHIVFEDDFNGPLDVSMTNQNAKWFPTKPEPHGTDQFGDAAFVDPDNLFGAENPFYQRGSFLRIRCRYIPTAQDPIPAYGRKWFTGMLSTGRPGGQGGFYAPVPYYAECRFLAPIGGVTWPAFWQLTKEGLLDPTHGNVETDTVEHIGLFPRNYRSGGILYTSTGATGRGAPLGQPATYVDDDSCFDFHTYGCLVTPTKTEMFLDNVSLGYYPTDMIPGVPTRSDFFMINLGFGGGGWGDQWNCTLPGTDHYDMWIDFVRVWRP